MNLLRVTTLVALAALASACASTPPVAVGPPPAETLVVGEAAAPAAGPAEPGFVADATPAVGTAPAAETPPAATDGTAAEDDYSAIYGDEYNPVADPTLPPGVQMPVSYDPWEKFNRNMHSFNNAVDRAVARPLAQTYVKVVPRPARLGVSNFFSNLGEPITALNSLLQGKPVQAGQSLGRFLLNSTLGIGGIFDPASDAKLPRKNEDFGQTLGVWGWKRSRYVELPLFGPRTIRDVFGLIGDSPLSLIRGVEDDKTRFFLQGLQLVDVRTQLLSVDALREGAVDEYALFRDSWLQRRNYQIGDDRRKSDDENLPDYLLEEEENPTVPMDAMPVLVPTPGG
ncbi:VacJ family lipoprotein [Pseudoxanthomonas gei]|uniref:VacJ family lipoprotein n=1 Tax=Pseudoxanthomonas gei TaxID=1383030 RepID=A0ABX0ABC6_9GAMM|nr:MlaA family lipoprotein [Pseudoxanthomonas gei]NDK38870.1 VacJ family lipoprotein [Pseudoxanthomonas gei]